MQEKKIKNLDHYKMATKFRSPSQWPRCFGRLVHTPLIVWQPKFGHQCKKIKLKRNLDHKKMVTKFQSPPQWPTYLVNLSTP